MRSGMWSLFLLPCLVIAAAASPPRAPLRASTLPPPGCVTAPAAGSSDNSVLVGRLVRTYTLHVPPHGRAGWRYPLLLAFHGSGGNGRGMAADTELSTLADEHAFIVVYPDGTKGGFWNVGPYSDTTADDVAFISQLIDVLSQRLCIDHRRIFATGISEGGGMAHRLACDLALRIAAIGPVAGGYIDTACHPQRPVSVIAFHGTADPLVPYHGGRLRCRTVKGCAPGRLPDIPTWARGWAFLDGCRQGPTVFMHAQDVTAVRYTRCHGHAEVQLYTIRDGDHAWPGPGTGTPTIDASELMWSFFVDHPLP